MIAERLPSMLEKTLPSIATAAVAIVTAITNVLPTLAPVLADSLSVLIQELVPYLPSPHSGSRAANIPSNHSGKCSA